jgi:hypothetical protein
MRPWVGIIPESPRSILGDYAGARSDDEGHGVWTGSRKLDWRRRRKVS